MTILPYYGTGSKALCAVLYSTVLWCGVVWCGVVYCNVLYCTELWCGVVWCGVVCITSLVDLKTHIDKHC